MSAWSEPGALHCEEHGHGEPLLLIHGFGASSYSWHYWLPELARRNRVFLIDLKGFGRSPKPAGGDYSLHEQARLVTDFIRGRDLRGLTLGGHSMGGGVALLVALGLQQDARLRPRRLILIDNVAYRQPLPLFIRLLRTPLVGALCAHLTPARLQVTAVLRLAYYDDSRISPEDVAAYAEPLGQAGGKPALLRTARQLIPADVDQLAARYPQIDVPTLILWGRQDAIVPLWVGERLQRAIAGSRLVVIDRCGHIPHEECPRAAWGPVSDFLTET